MRRDTILVVDDSPETLGFLTDTLDAAGFMVLISTDGESALSLVEQITPDLMLLDAVMPGLDGFETCRRLKGEKLLRHMPVIFMTGLSETEHVVQGLAAGGVDYVTKPIIVNELLARIRVHLTNARIAQGSHIALDASGRFLFATDVHGRLLWCTPKAGRLLTELFPDAESLSTCLPPPVAGELRRLAESPSPSATASVEVGGRCLELSFLSSTGPDELLFRLSEVSRDTDERLLRHSLALTTRESEVLRWLSCGKSNREIGQILAISPRTVNKHLEQIFVKLGVENRAAAVARAMRALAK